MRKVINNFKSSQNHLFRMNQIIKNLLTDEIKKKIAAISSADVTGSVRTSS